MSRRKRRKKSERSQQGDGAEVEASAASAGSDGSGSEETEASAGAEADEPEAGSHGTEESPVEPVEPPELVELRARAEEMRELAQRKQAEFENYRKRVERERADTIQYASSELVREILPVLDNLERALAASESGGGEEQLREGVSIIYRQFKDILERRGLAEVETDEKAFDPHVHEAVSRVETNDYPEGRVVDVLQKGYWLKDRLLRPAMVSVALPASSPGEEEEGE